MNITELRTKTIISALIEKGADYCSFYGERGYTNPEKGVILYNWNDVGDTIAEYLEEAGYSLEWSDEWIIDYENDKAYRVSGNSYHWCCQVKYAENGELLTPDSSISDWIDEVKEVKVDYHYNTAISCIPEFVTDSQLENEGYIKYNSDSFETGLHMHQTDNPQTIAKKLFESIDNVESIVFKLDESSQFYCSWSAFYKLED